MGPVTCAASSHHASMSITTSKMLQAEALKKGEEGVVLLACGSFNPPHRAHVRMLELAKVSAYSP